jgi:magnesium transporter
MNGAMPEIFLSSVLGKIVITPQGHEVGRLRDLVMTPGEHFPEVSHLLVEHQGCLISVPWQRVTLFNRFVISITGSPQSIPQYVRHDRDILLKRDILDRQIVDVNGAKVVRVNDLKLGSFHDRLCVFFVDVGFRGLLRRMGYEHIGERIASLFKHQLPYYHISWEYVQLLDTNLFRLTLTVARDQLKEIHPADLAHILSNIPQGNVQAVLNELDMETAGEAIHELEPDLRSRIISQLDPEQACRILEQMDPDEAADVLGNCSEEKAQELLGLMDEEGADRIQELLVHEEDTVGALMNSRFVAIYDDITGAEALRVVQTKAASIDTIYYVYVLDKRDHLKGVLSLKDLLVNGPEARISEFMTTVVKSAYVDSTPHEALETVAKYNFIAIPVLNREGGMVGIVTVDDLVELFLPSAVRRKLHRSG